MPTRDTRIRAPSASTFDWSMDPARLPVRGGDVFAGKYVIDRVIGSGAMGVVVAANHAQLGEKVVLKFLRAGMAKRPDLVARFLREARSAVRIRSEHVARVLDAGTIDGDRPYIVMEHLEGCDLQELLHRRGPLPVAEAVEYVAQACLAMAEAHAMGVVHRDLKPSNIFLCRRGDGSPLIKVLDFGISKVIAEGCDQTDLTATNGILGSPIYISPEQAKSARSVDARADVWSLGVILHHLLVGQPPFVGDSITEVLSAILLSPPKHLSEALVGAPPELEDILLRCLEKDVEKRTPSVVALAVALAPWAKPDSRAAISRIASAPPKKRAVGSAADEAHEGAAGNEGGRGVMASAASGRRRAALKTAGIAVAVIASAAAGAALFARREEPPLSSPTVVNISAESPDIARRAPSPASPARTAPPIDSGSPIVPSVADSSGAPEASARPPAPHPSKPSKPTGSRAPGSTASSTPTGYPAPIDPGSLTFDLGAAPSAGHVAR
jgi:serine/threonine protein kinase